MVGCGDPARFICLLCHQKSERSGCAGSSDDLAAGNCNPRYRRSQFHHASLVHVAVAPRQGGRCSGCAAPWRRRKLMKPYPPTSHQACIARQLDESIRVKKTAPVPSWRRAERGGETRKENGPKPSGGRKPLVVASVRLSTASVDRYGSRGFGAAIPTVLCRGRA